MKIETFKRGKILAFTILPTFIILSIVFALQFSTQKSEARVTAQCPSLEENDLSLCTLSCTMVVTGVTAPTGYTCTPLPAGGALLCTFTIAATSPIPTGADCPSTSLTCPASARYTQAGRDAFCNGPMGSLRATSDGTPTPCIRERCQNTNCRVDGPDTTSTGCTAKPVCGNNNLDPGEVCDGTLGTCGAGLSCVDCQCVPRCGDGIVAGAEACDYRADGTPVLGANCAVGSGCNSDCRCTPPTSRCGDHMLNGTETCEKRADGSFEFALACVAGSTCNPATCICNPPPPAVCGNNRVEGGESCDGTDLGVCTAPGASCSTVCKCVIPDCGDGEVNGTEECDGNNAICERTRGAGSTCNACRCIPPPKPVCPNGRIEAGEECDGNTKNCPTTGSTCVSCKCIPPTRTQTPICGDGKVNQDSETCDRLATVTDLRNPTFNLLDVCRENCTYCGDGIKNDIEECDPRATTPALPANTFCDNTCKIKPRPSIQQAPAAPFCGDGILSAGESCDSVNGKLVGCSSEEFLCEKCQCLELFLEGSGARCSLNISSPIQTHGQNKGTTALALLFAFMMANIVYLRRKKLN